MADAPTSGINDTQAKITSSTASPRRASFGDRIISTLKKPFHKDHKEERPEALDNAIRAMEERKQNTVEDMHNEGKDTRALEGNKIDKVGLGVGKK